MTVTSAGVRAVRYCGVHLGSGDLQGRPNEHAVAAREGLANSIGANSGAQTGTQSRIVWLSFEQVKGVSAADHQSVCIWTPLLMTVQLGTSR